jgi:hypothetical protein
MSMETVSIIVLDVTTICVVIIALFGMAFFVFVVGKALVKAANVELVFKQAAAFGRAVRRAPQEQATEASGRLKTRTRMVDTDDDELRGAVTYHDDDDLDDEDPNQSQRGDINAGAVTTMDENAGFNTDEPPVQGRPVVGRSA